MTIRTGKDRRYRYYTCSTKARQRPTACNDMTLPMEKTNALVAMHLEERLLNPARLEEVLATVLDRRQNGQSAAADLDDSDLKVRIASLQAIRTSHASMLTEHRQCSKARARRPSQRQFSPSSRKPHGNECDCPVEVTAATISARPPSASRSTKAKFGSWGRNPTCCGRLPPPVPERCRAQCPALFRNGGQGGNRTDHLTC